MKTTTKQKNFTMISDKLCRVPIKKISQTEKLYIAYILRYQANGNTLFASNKSIGEQLGIDGGSVKKLNNKMNKQFNFFSAIQDKKYENGAEYSSSHTIKVDEKLLDEFLDNVSTFVKDKPSIKKEAAQSTISTEPIEEDQIEEIMSEIEDNKLNPTKELKELINDNEYLMKSDITFKVISIFKGFSDYEVDGFIKDIYGNYRKIKSGEFNLDEYINNKLTQKELV